MLTELPQQGSWVPRIGEIVVYISDAKTEFRQARIVTDSSFWLINPENRQLLGRPEWRAGKQLIMMVFHPHLLIGTKKTYRCDSASP